MPAGLIDRAVERHFPGVYWNPGRWATADGVVPFPMFRLYAQALWPLLALERLNTSAAIGLVFGGKDAATRREDTIREAYPGKE